MKPPIVLVIHGMGTHVTGDVIKEVKTGLNASASFLGLQNFALDTHFDFEEYNYSEYFDEQRKAQGDFFKALGKVIPFSSRFLQELFQFQAKLADDSFFYTHWLDVITYGVLDTIRITAMLRLKEKLLTLLRDAANDAEGKRDVIVVAHSLGTAMTHDVLTSLYLRPDEPDDDEKIRYINHPLSGLWMVANVSRMTQILTRYLDPNHSIVRDDSANSAGVAKIYYPIYNQFDPFTVFKRYLVEPVYGDLIRTNSLRFIKHTDGSKTVNPRSLTEYFSDPEVGAEFLYQHTMLQITPAMRQAAKVKYLTTTIDGELKDAVKEILAKIKALSNTVNASNDLLSLISCSMQLFLFVKELKDLYATSSKQGA